MPLSSVIQLAPLGLSGLKPEPSMIDPGTNVPAGVEAAGADALDLHLVVHDQVLGVLTLRVGR